MFTPFLGDESMNIASNLDQAAQSFPDKTVIQFEERSMTYKELQSKTDCLAAGLKKLGIIPGDRVAILMPNIPEFAVVYYAIQKTGAIAVSLNVMLKQDEVSYIINNSGAATLFTTQALAGEVNQDEMPKLKTVIIVEGDADGRIHMDDVFLADCGSFETMEMDPDDDAAILYTSGTTGFPKGATLSQSNIVSNVNATVYHTDMTKNDVLQLFLPLFHCFGQNFILNACIKAGATVVMHRRFEPQPVLEAIQKHKVTMFFAVPTIYIYLLNMENASADLSGIRYFFTAAANMPKEVAVKWLETHKIPINDGYGLTETSPFASYNHEHAYKTGSVGSPVMDVEMKITDENGNEPPPGTWGEICIKGPNVMTGYWNNPEATADSIKDGWFHSGDIGTMDEKGYFFIVDRVKDMINSAGNKIYPAEVENILYQHPAIHETAVYGLPDPEKGESVTAAIVLKPEASLNEKEIINFCQSRIAKYKVPKTVLFIEELPKSPTGKILKRILRDDG